MEQRKRPEPLKTFLTEDHGNGIIEITAPPMRFKQYLVIGDEKALLIDTGFGYGSLKKVVEKLTDKPIILVKTHGHPDHGGGNAEFGSPLMDPADNELYAYKCAYEVRLDEAMHWHVDDAAEKLQPTPPAPTALEDGHVFDLGGRTLKVIRTPGHTRGSVCIYDEKTNSLFTGDNTNDHGVSLAEKAAASVSTYLESLMKIKAVGADTLYTGHMPGKVAPEKVDCYIACAKRILAGERGAYVETPMARGYKLDADGASIQYDPERIQ